MVVLDTSIIIDHLRQKNRNDSALLRVARAMRKEELAISAVTVQELYTGRSSGNPEAEILLLATITPLQIIPYTYEIAQRAGELSRDASCKLTFADAAIAATSLAHHASLYTLNQKDFVGIPGLSLWDSATAG